LSDDPARRQRRGASIAMSPSELDDFLGHEHTCRVATTTHDGVHNAPLWFVWHDGALWIYSSVKSQRWTDLQRDRRVAVVVDAGERYDELRGAELRGSVAFVGEVPRIGEPDAELVEPERLFAGKYRGAEEMQFDQRHAWARLSPDKITSWDFRKLTKGADAFTSPVRAWVDRYVATVNAGAYDDLGGQFTDDAVFLAPDGSTYTGAGEIAAFYGAHLRATRPRVRVSTLMEDGAEAMFVLSASTVDQPEERLGAVDHVTVDRSGRATRLVVFVRPPS
jgi:hypothetical protein